MSSGNIMLMGFEQDSVGCRQSAARETWTRACVAQRSRSGTTRVGAFAIRKLVQTLRTCQEQGESAFRVKSWRRVELCHRQYVHGIRNGTPITISAGCDGVRKALFAHVVPWHRHESRLRRKCTRAQRVVHRSSESDTTERPRAVHHRRQAQSWHKHTRIENVHEESPVGDSNPDGNIERAITSIQGQLRAIEDITER